MLRCYPPGESAEPLWIDLVDPTADERERAAKALGAELPTRREVSSIVMSTRLRTEEELLRIGIPGFVRADAGQGEMTPLGVLLTPRLLVTLRYADSMAFDRLSRDVAREAAPASSVDAFVTLFETVAQTAGDRMETIAAELSKLSRSVFADHSVHSHALRHVLFAVGAAQRELAQIRTAMLGVQRGLSHLCEVAPKWVGKAQVARLKAVESDLKALSHFDQQMDDKVQFLLDATLGFINIEQNDLIKFLTIASVVTIPPMILAAIWGMNFKSIPEYAWTHGYAFAWAMIVLSIGLPLAWFRWKKWF